MTWRDVGVGLIGAGLIYALLIFVAAAIERRRGGEHDSDSILRLLTNPALFLAAGAAVLHYWG